jgi:hypothetical protein
VLIVAASLAAGAARADPVYFNHAMIIVDPQTYAALVADPFLGKEFARAETRNTAVDGGGTAWRGFYVYGRSTYLEFMSAGESFVGKAAPGSAALGMWVDRQAALSPFLESLNRELGTRMLLHTRTRRVGDSDIPWFVYTDFADPKQSPDSSDTWLMSPYPDYLARTHPDDPPRGDTISRTSHQAYRYDPGRLLRDVIAIRLVAGAAEVKRMAAEFRAYGETVSSQGREVRVRTPDCTIILVPARPHEGYSTTVTFALNPLAHLSGSRRIGHTLLTLGRNSARWQIGAEDKSP